MKVHVDAAACDGFGVCHDILPEVFLLDDDGYAYVAGDGTVEEEREASAREAVHACPVHAIAARDE